MAIGNMKHWWKHISVAFVAAFTILNVLSTTFALAFVVIYLYSQRLKNGPKIPSAPGPKPWPILGSIHLMDGFRVRNVPNFLLVNWDLYLIKSLI